MKPLGFVSKIHATHTHTHSHTHTPPPPPPPPVLVASHTHSIISYACDIKLYSFTRRNRNRFFREFARCLSAGWVRFILWLGQAKLEKIPSQSFPVRMGVCTWTKLHRLHTASIPTGLMQTRGKWCMHSCTGKCLASNPVMGLAGRATHWQVLGMGLAGRATHC